MLCLLVESGILLFRPLVPNTKPSIITRNIDCNYTKKQRNPDTKHISISDSDKNIDTDHGTSDSEQL